MFGIKMKKCFLDMDGVLVDFTGGVRKWFKIPKKKIEAIPKPRPWNHIVDVTGLSEKDFWEEIDLPDFWYGLKWMPDGKAILDLVIDSFGLESIMIFTNPSGKASAMHGKTDWIAKHLPRFKNRVIFGGNKHFCAHEDVVLIDDNQDYVHQFEDEGGYGILVPRPWNELHYVEDAVSHIDEALFTRFKL